MGACFSNSDYQVGPSLEMHFYSSGEETTTSDTQYERNVKKRTTTDVTFLLFMTFFYLILMGFLWYCAYYGRAYRIIYGYDNCGNVCGKINKAYAYEGLNCSGVNMIDKPFLLVSGSSEISVKPMQNERECVTNCNIYPDYQEFLNRCIPKKDEHVVNTFFSKTGLRDFFQEVTEDFYLCYKEVAYLCLIAFGFSIAIIILMRYLVGVIVWLVLFGAIVASVYATAYLWVLCMFSGETMMDVSEVDSRKHYTFLALAITASIVTFIVIVVIVFMRKRVKLVVQLFKESGKALAAMPLLLFQPILTFIALGVVVSMWFYISLWIESAGHIKQTRPKHIDYQKDIWIILTRWLNLFGMFWMCQYVIGCQHMIIGGAVSKWYFTRNKMNLKRPVFESTYNLIRYHLGTVAVGSFIIALVQLIRVVLTVISKYLNNKEGRCAAAATKCCQCCLFYFEVVLKYLNRNAYIETAINGYCFCKAGHQAFTLLVSNVVRVAAINSVGDFVLFLGKLVVVVATILLGVEVLKQKDGIQHMWVPLTLVGIFAYLVSHCFLTVYEMTIDTIFLCFCEDCELNNGISQPYYMSKDLMRFIENSKRTLRVSDNTVRAPQAWQATAAVGPSTISK